MKKKDKQALVALMGAIGFIILLAGIFTAVDFYYALFAALALWILSGVAKIYLGIDKKK